MNDPQRERLPIGYWLKRADELLTARIDEAQRSNGLSRLEWQLLNLLHERGGVTGEQIAELLKPFAAAPALAELCRGLVARGLIGEQGGAGYALTEEGAALREQALAAQTAIRQRAMVGIEPEAYGTTVRVLWRLVENLEREGGA